MARRTHRTKVAVQRVRDPVPEEAAGGHGAGPGGQAQAQEGSRRRQGRSRRRAGEGRRGGRRQREGLLPDGQDADRGAPHGGVRQGRRAQAAPPDAEEEAILPRRGGAGRHPPHGAILRRHLRLIDRSACVQELLVVWIRSAQPCRVEGRKEKMKQVNNRAIDVVA